MKFYEELLRQKREVEQKILELEKELKKCKNVLKETERKIEKFEKVLMEGNYKKARVTYSSFPFHPYGGANPDKILKTWHVEKMMPIEEIAELKTKEGEVISMGVKLIKVEILD